MLSRWATGDATRIDQFIANNYALSRKLLEENFLEHQKNPNYEHDCKFIHIKLITYIDKMNM